MSKATKQRIRRRTTHPMIRDIAKEMAGALYEELAKNNTWFLMNPSQAQFIAHAHGSLIDQARSTLAEMLGGTALGEAEKEKIAEALRLDAGLQYGRDTTTRIATPGRVFV